MERLPRAAILLALLDQLHAHGSWCGETSVQKSVYFVQELLEVPLGFDYIFYKYGPFSFELSDELTALRGDGLLRVVIRDPRYAPSLLPGEAAPSFLERFPRTQARYAQAIRFVAERLASKNVADLEKLATALYVRKQNPGSTDQDQLAEAIHSLKPHVALADARTALQVVGRMTEEANNLGG